MTVSPETSSFFHVRITTTRLNQVCALLLSGDRLCRVQQLTSLEGDGGVASAARRRRERRLRSWWNHEQQTVRMALSAAVHHSFDKVAAGEKYYAPRGQKTDRAETRPEPLEEVPVPQGAVTVGCVAAPGPLLSTPLLGDTAVETVDARTVKFLLQKTFARKKEEEEEEEEERRKEVAKQQEEKYEAKMLLLNDRVSHDLPLAEDEWAAWREWSVLVPSSSSSGKRRKRKKRRKRRLPRGARIRRCGQGFRSRSSLTGAQCSLWSSTGLRCPASWPECTRWTAPRSSSSMAVACARVVLVATADLVLCSLLLVTGPRCLTSWPVRIRRTVTFTLVACLDGLLVTLHLALCFFPCRQAQSPERVDSSYF